MIPLSYCCIHVDLKKKFLSACLGVYLTGSLGFTNLIYIFLLQSCQNFLHSNFVVGGGLPYLLKMVGGVHIKSSANGTNSQELHPLLHSKSLLPLLPIIS